MCKKKSQDSAIEPELRGQTPRAVRYTSGTQKTRFWLWLLFVGVMAPLLGTALHDLGQMRTLLARGKTATGSIIAHDMTYGKHNPYRLDYIFQAEGAVISDSADVSHWEYDQTRDGGPLTITYLPGNPHIHRVGTVNRQGFDVTIAGWAVGGSLAFLLLGGLLLRTEMLAQGARRLLQNGQAVTGVVTERKEKTVQGKYGPTTTYTLCYRFSTPSGEQTGQSVVNGAPLSAVSARCSADGLYDAQKPARNQPYRALTEVRLA